LGIGAVGSDGVFLAIVCVFSMIILQSVLFSHHPDHSLASLTRVAKVFALVFLVVHFVRSPGQLRELAFVIFVGTLATIVIGVISLKLGIYTTGNVIGGVEIYRFSGAHPNPNRAAAIICSAIPLGVFVARHAGNAWRRTLAYAGVIALVIGVFSTFSRSAIFPFSVVAMAVVAREIRSRGGFAAVAALLIVGILLTPQFYWDRLFALSDVKTTGMFTDMSVAIRFDAMRTAWKLFLAHPLTGIGFYDFIFRRASDVIATVVTHNTYLEILVGTGIFGFAAFMGSVVAGLRHAAYGALRVWTRESASMRSLSFYVGLSGVSIMISAMFGSMPFVYAYWMPVACGLVVGNLIRGESVTD
jgi:putative inorganic carbon (HCO3(-)) transporter